MKKNVSIVAMVLLFALAAAAQESRIYQEGGNWTRQINGTLSGARNLQIKVDLGAVIVRGGSQTGITYTIRNQSFAGSEQRARRDFDSYRVNVSLRGDTAWIVADWEGASAKKFNGTISVEVPRSMNLVKIETDGGAISASAIEGRVEAASGGGSLQLDDIGGVVRGETGGGSIEVGNVGADLNLQTGGGSIHIRSAKGHVVAETGGGSVTLGSGLRDATISTGGGSIDVRQCVGRLKASTGGGSIDAGDVGGSADFETGGGSIRLTSAKGAVRAETAGGSIELYGVPGARAETAAGGITAKFTAHEPFTDSVLETTAGDITIYLSPAIHASVRASIDLANGHRIHSDFSEIQIHSEGGDYGPKTISADGRLNGGGPLLKVRTTTGDITFRRAQ